MLNNTLTIVKTINYKLQYRQVDVLPPYKHHSKPFLMVSYEFVQDLLGQELQNPSKISPRKGSLYQTEFIPLTKNVSLVP